MTIEELYKWAAENNALDFQIGLQYQDSGGEYIGDTWEDQQAELRASIEVAFHKNYVKLS